MAMTKNSGPIQLWLQFKEHNNITKIGSEEALYEPSVRENPGLALSYRRASVRHALRPDAFLSSRIFIDTDIVIRKRHGTTVKKGADVAKQGGEAARRAANWISNTRLPPLRMMYV
nr:hypothetical protein Iba_chr12aCG17640 [Ipomoea batatas]